MADDEMAPATEVAEETVADDAVADDTQTGQDAPVTDENPDATSDSAEGDVTDDSPGDDTQTPEEDSQESELDPTLVERAARYNVEEAKLQELGEYAGAFVDHIESMETARMLDAGKRALEDQAAPPDGATEPDKDSVQPATVDDDAFIKDLEERGFDEDTIGVFKAQRAESDTRFQKATNQIQALQAKVDGFFQAQQQAADAQAEKAWRDELPKEKLALLDDPEVDKKMRETAMALDIGFTKSTGKQMDMRDLLDRSFKLAAGDKLVAQAAADAKKKTLDAAERRSALSGQAPAGQTRRNGPRKTIDDYRARAAKRMNQL